MLEKAGIPVVQITAVSNVATMMGVNKVLRGETVPCVLGNSALPREAEKELRRKYVLRAMEILRLNVTGSNVYGLEGMV